MPDRREPHPLDPLAADEVRDARKILDAAGALRPSTRFAYLGSPSRRRPSSPVTRRSTAAPARC